jgi:transcription elongation factor GreB
MSRGFVKEGDQEEAPIITPRAALPPQETNYVRPQGYQALEKELKDLEADRQNTSDMSEAEARRHKMLIDGKINLLKERMSSARILDPKDQPQDEVRFGACVKVKYLTGPLKGKSISLTLTGVDEADLKQQKIAFVAPLAKSLSGAKVGEERNLNLGGEIRTMQVLAIDYSS